MKSKLLTRLLLLSKKPTSVQEALGRLFSQSDLEVVLGQCADPRELLATVASLTGEPNGEIVKIVAEQLGIPYLNRIAPIEIEELSSSPRASLESYREAGAIPIVLEKVRVGYACADPGLLSSREGFRGRYWLAEWRVIREALEISEQRLQTLELERELSERRESRRIVLRTLQLIAQEAKGHGATAIGISRVGERLQYHFKSADGRRALGTVHPKVQDSVEDFLFEEIESETFLKTLPGFRGFTIRPSEREVELTFEGPKAVQQESTQSQPMKVGHLSIVSKGEAEEAEIEEPLNFSVQEEVVFSKAEIGPKVLVIDDNEVFRCVLHRFLERLGLVSVMASHGKEAMALIQQLPEPPAAIICDIHMPHMNGIEFVKRLRAIDVVRDVPIVMLTSDDNIETEVEVIGAGADAYLRKNQDPRLLSAYVHRLVEKRRAA